MDNESFNMRVPNGWVRTALIVGATALIVAPLTAVAAHVFNDVPESHTFHNDITWLADAGVTRGCNPPDNTEYCPDDNVTRGQMAAFMKRFAGYIDAEDGTPAQADNAATADNADNADTVDGQDADVLAGVTAAQGYDWFTVVELLDVGTDGTIIAETEIDVPADGHLVLIGTATVGNSLTDGSVYTIWIEVDEGGCELGGPNEPANSAPGAATFVADGTADDYSAAVSGVAAVEQGARTVTLCGAHENGDGNVFNASLIAQYTGEATTSVVTSGASSEGSGGPDN